jgi:hypothetical protein
VQAEASIENVAGCFERNVVVHLELLVLVQSPWLRSALLRCRG